MMVLTVEDQTHLDSAIVEDRADRNSTAVEGRTDPDSTTRVVVLGLLLLGVLWLFKRHSPQVPPYSMHIDWSAEDGVFVVSLPEWGPYARTHGATREEAVAAGQEVLQMLIQNRVADKRPLPGLPHPPAFQAA